MGLMASWDNVLALQFVRPDVLEPLPHRIKYRRSASTSYVLTGCLTVRTSQIPKSESSYIIDMT